MQLEEIIFIKKVNNTHSSHGKLLMYTAKVDKKGLIKRKLNRKIVKKND